MKRTTLILTGLTLCALLVACKSNAPIGVEKIQYGVPAGGIPVDPVHGKETWFAYGAMSGVEGTPANGVADIHRFEDGHYLHTASLNIAITADGTFYEAWLTDGEKMISTGHMTNPFGDVRHQVRFESNTDVEKYLKVVVTLEKDDGNPVPGKHVAEGTMKVTVRPGARK